MPTCPFCSIDKERQRVLMECIYVYVMPSNPRLTLHHLLVIPKRHILYPSELRPEERQELFDTVIWFQARILTSLPGMGCDVRQNLRPFLPEDDVKVDHIHWHLLPRTREDEIYLKTQVHEKDLFEKGRLPPEVMKQEMATLRRLLFLP